MDRDSNHIASQMLDFHQRYKDVSNPLSEYIDYSSVKVVTITSMCRFDNIINLDLIYILYPLDIDILGRYEVIPRNKGKMTVTGLPNYSTYTKRKAEKICGLTTCVERRWMHSVSIDVATSGIQRDKTGGYGNVNFKISNTNIHCCGINDESKINSIYVDVINKVNRSIREYNSIRAGKLDISILFTLSASDHISFKSLKSKKKWLKRNIKDKFTRNSLIVSNSLKQSKNTNDFYDLFLSYYLQLNSLEDNEYDEIDDISITIEMMKNTFNIKNILIDNHITIKKLCEYLDTIPMMKYMVQYHSDIDRHPRIMIPQHDNLDELGNPITFYDKMHTITILSSGIVNHTAFGGSSVEKVFNIFMSMIYDCIIAKSKNRKINNIINSICVDDSELLESSSEIDILCSSDDSS